MDWEPALGGDELEQPYWRLDGAPERIRGFRNLHETLAIFGTLIVEETY